MFVCVGVCWVCGGVFLCVGVFRSFVWLFVGVYVCVGLCLCGCFCVCRYKTKRISGYYS